MQVILLEKVGKLGNLGDVVKVKEGYARNYLIPTKQARRATEAAIKEFEARRADLEKAAAAKLAAAQALGEQMSGKVVRIAAEGRRRRPPVRLGHQRRHRRSPDQDGPGGAEVAGAHAHGPLKTVGEHTVSVAPHTDVVVDVTVQVVRRPTDRAKLSFRACEGRLCRPSSFVARELSRGRPPHHPQACPQPRAPDVCHHALPASPITP
jgi:large subunit ribosomal protein L9